MRWISKVQFSVPSSQFSVTPLRLRAENWELRTSVLAILLIGAALLISAAPSATSENEKHLSVYSPVALYTLPIVERSGRDYVGLLELLEPLGRVTTESSGRSLKLRYNALDAEFVAGKTRAKVRGQDFDFPAPFLIENSRGLVPLSSLASLLPRFLGTAVNFHEGARRLFIGDVGIQPSFRLDAGNPPRLELNFSSPVNPTISTEPGKLRMVFQRDPVVSPGSQSISFDNPIITHAAYSENDGDAELDVAANQPLMATFSSDRRTIVVAAVPSSSAAPAATVSPNPAQPTRAANAASGNSSNALHRILAIVDAAHGGDERGAALTDTLAEKDVTLGFARLLRHELEIRGFAVAMLRDADVGLSLDQRATSANGASAVIFITLHATSQGSGARVYTALLPVGGANKGVFHAWNAAQAPALPVSQTVAAAIVAELQKKGFSAQKSSASLRPLNNVLMPAVAVELATGPNGVADLSSANYQQRVAAAIADAVAPMRDNLGVQVGVQP